MYLAKLVFAGECLQFHVMFLNEILFYGNSMLGIYRLSIMYDKFQLMEMNFVCKLSIIRVMNRRLLKLISVCA